MGGVVFTESDKHLMGEQLPLFQDKYMLLNGASQELAKLNLHEARKAFQRFMKLFKGIDFIDIRRQMKDMNPSLFSRYIKYIESRDRHKG